MYVCMYVHIYEIMCVLFIIHLDIRGSLNKFPDFFHMGTFIDSKHMKL